MIIKTEISNFDEFKPWSGGKDTLDDLSESQKERLFEYAEEIFPEGCTDTELNDWLWFERDNIYEHLKIDSNGNDIGSVEWARPILMDYAKEKEFHTSQFGNIYNIITCFLDEEYDESDENEDDLKYDFDRYILDKWKEFVKQQLMAWHSDLGGDLIEEWLDKHYDNENEIPDHEEVADAFNEYVELLNNSNDD